MFVHVCFCECDCVVPGCVYVCLVFDVCEPVNVSVCVWVCVLHITCVCVLAVTYTRKNSVFDSAIACVL